MKAATYQWHGQTLHLHPLKGLYWEEYQALLLADVHIGKATHFRKAGIAVPGGVIQRILQDFTHLLNQFQPSRILILGDLFHSTVNSEWHLFQDFLKLHASIKFELIPGNHDRASEVVWDKLPMQILPPTHILDPFVLSHDPLEEIPTGLYNISGHIHPSVRLNGKGRQRLRLPCFYFTENQLILPAFGAFTGTYDIKPCAGDHIYVVAQQEVLKVSE